MPYRVITPPEPIVDATTAKAWSRPLASASDELAEAFIAVAQANIERSWLGRAFGVQTLEESFASFGCGTLRLSFPPLRAINSIAYTDAEGAPQILPDTVYEAFGEGTNFGGIRLQPDQSWPALALRSDAVRVEYEAGYDVDDPELLKAQMAVAMAAGRVQTLMLSDPALRSRTIEGVGEWQWAASDGVERAMELASDNLLRDYRVIT